MVNLKIKLNGKIKMVPSKVHSTAWSKNGGCIFAFLYTVEEWYQAKYIVLLGQKMEDAFLHFYT